MLVRDGTLFAGDGSLGGRRTGGSRLIFPVPSNRPAMRVPGVLLSVGECVVARLRNIRGVPLMLEW